MKKIDYFQIIHKYLSPDSLAYSIYLPHVILVTAKALKIAKKLKLGEEQLRFIEEAGMLHDIGISKVKSEDLGLNGNSPYISHIIEGEKILKAEGLLKHARIAKNHIGVGISKEEIINRGLPLPQEDIFPEILEEKIISYADLFYSKSRGRLWQKKTFAEVKKEIAKFGEKHLIVLEEWHQMFGD